MLASIDGDTMPLPLEHSQTDVDPMPLSLEHLSQQYRSAIAAIVDAHKTDLARLQLTIEQLKGQPPSREMLDLDSMQSRRFGNSAEIAPASVPQSLVPFPSETREKKLEPYSAQQDSAFEPMRGQPHRSASNLSASAQILPFFSGSRGTDLTQSRQSEVAVEQTKKRVDATNRGGSLSRNTKVSLASHSRAPAQLTQSRHVEQTHAQERLDLIFQDEDSIETQTHHLHILPRFRKNRPSASSEAFSHNATGSSMLRSMTTGAVNVKSVTSKRFSGSVATIDMLYQDDDTIEQDKLKNASCLRRLVAHSYFELGTGLIIATNAIFIGYQCDLDMKNTNTQQRPTWMIVVQRAYMVAFIVDLVLRWVATGTVEFLCSRTLWFWNCLDMFVVLFSLIEWALEILTTGNQINMSILRLMRFVRLARLARVLRVGRLLKLFRPFRILVYSIVGTLKTVCWAVLLLVIIIYTFSLMLAQNVGEFLSVTNDVPAEISIYWSTLPRVMFTLFKSVMGGMSWHDCVLPLASINDASVIIFLCYICLSSLAVLNVITGVFCESAIEGAQADRDLVVHKLMQKRTQYEKMLYGLFKDIDTDDSDQITLEEFTTHLRDDETRAFFATLEIEIEKACEIFQLLDTDETGSIDIEEFVSGCLRLRGNATSVDCARIYEMVKRTNGLLEVTLDIISEIRAKELEGGIQPGLRRMNGFLDV